MNNGGCDGSKSKHRVFPVATVAGPVPNKSECQFQPEYGERGTGKVCLLPTVTGQMYHLSLSHRLLPSLLQIDMYMCTWILGGWIERYVDRWKTYCYNLLYHPPCYKQYFKCLFITNKRQISHSWLYSSNYICTQDFDAPHQGPFFSIYRCADSSPMDPWYIPFYILHIWFIIYIYIQIKIIYHKNPKHIYLVFLGITHHYITNVFGFLDFLVCFSQIAYCWFYYHIYI